MRYVRCVWLWRECLFVWVCLRRKGVILNRKVFDIIRKAYTFITYKFSGLGRQSFFMYIKRRSFQELYKMWDVENIVQLACIMFTLPYRFGIHTLCCIHAIYLYTKRDKLYSRLLYLLIDCVCFVVLYIFNITPIPRVVYLYNLLTSMPKVFYFYLSSK